jgi:selenide,water dikinase
LGDGKGISGIDAFVGIRSSMCGMTVIIDVEVSDSKRFRTGHIDWSRVPLLAGVKTLAEQGLVTGASWRNWAGYGQDVVLAEGLEAQAQALLTDPQTSGGLLVACAPDAVDAVLAVFHRHGFAAACDIGGIEAITQGQPTLVVGV